MAQNVTMSHSWFGQLYVWNVTKNCSKTVKIENATMSHCLLGPLYGPEYTLQNAWQRKKTTFLQMAWRSRAIGLIPTVGGTQELTSYAVYLPCPVYTRYEKKVSLQRSSLATAADVRHDTSRAMGPCSSTEMPPIRVITAYLYSQAPWVEKKPR